MADSKITALTSIGTITDPAVDPLVIVDVSDTSMAATGTTKKVTLNNLLACSPTATLASATITGDLTVDTSTLKVDSANDRVGIGTATPVSYAGAKLVVYDASNSELAIANSTAYSKLQANGADLYINTNIPGVSSNAGSFIIRHGSGFTEQYRIASDGVVTWSNVGGVAGTAMTLNSTGLGVGVTSPAAGVKLHVGGGNAHIRNAVGGQTKLIFGTSVNSVEMGGIIYDDTDGSITFGTIQNYATRFITNNTERARFNTAGNLAFVSGKGIDFSAVTGGTGTATANVLNDYEEGTFTPTIVGTTTAGTGTYTVQTAQYTKIGKQVTVQLYLAWTAHTGTGNMVIGGLPFTTLNVGTAISAAALGFVDLIALTAGNIMTAYSSPNNTQIVLKQTPTGGGASTDVPIDTSGSIILTLTYIANA